MKKLIIVILIIFISISVYAKQFCVKIDCYKQSDKFLYNDIYFDVESEINKYLNQWYKLIAISPKIVVYQNGSRTKCYYCIFDDGK